MSHPQDQGDAGTHANTVWLILGILIAIYIHRDAPRCVEPLFALNAQVFCSSPLLVSILMGAFLAGIPVYAYKCFRGVS